VDSFGETKARLASSRTTIDDFDLLIGCTALTLGYAVVRLSLAPRQDRTPSEQAKGDGDD
jgi:predicted nucleic acid-binding protein